MEEEATETPTRPNPDGQAHLKKIRSFRVCSWNNCGKQFRTITGLDSHVMQIHRRGLTCSICKRMLPSQLALERHRLEHRVLCGTCGKSFASKSQLRRHLKNVHRANAEELEAPVTSVCGETTDRSTKLEEATETPTTPTRPNCDDEPRLKEAVFSCRFPCDHCKKLFRKIQALNSHIKQFHRVPDETTPSVPDEGSGATMPSAELEEKPLETCNLHGISNQHLKSVEPTSIVKLDETSAFKFNELVETKDVAFDLPYTLTDQEDNFQSVNRSTVTYQLSVKMEPEDPDEKTIIPPPDEPTNVSTAPQFVGVKEEAPGGNIGDNEGPTDPPQESSTKGKSAAKAMKTQTLTPGERRDYLQARKKLHPFPKNQKQWADLRIKFPDTCPYCPSKRLKAASQRQWRIHIEHHMTYSKEQEKTQAFADLWAKYTPCCLHCTREFPFRLSWYRHCQKSHGVSPSPDKEFQVLFKAVFDVSSIDEEGDFESGSEAEYFWLQLWTKYRPKCPVCSKEHSEKGALTRHMLSHHTSNRIGCNQCNASFKCKKNAALHERTMHNENCDKFAALCGECNKSFTGPNQKGTEQRLKDHMRRVHPDSTVPRPFLCQTCGKTFVYKDQLENHSYQHVDDRPFVCEKCPNSFKRKENLRKHVKRVHEGYPKKKAVKCKMCSDCGKLFTAQRYKIHVLSHTGERPFKCSQCDGAFKTSVSLKLHMVFHQGKRNYLCDICKSSFFLKHHLAAHMKTHSDEKPFHCDICSSDFRLKHHLQAHRSRLHGIQSGTSRGPKAKVIPGLESKPSADSSV